MTMTKNNMICYDYIIVGAGLSGLYQARLILKHYLKLQKQQQQQAQTPSSTSSSTCCIPKILILEANHRLGGRIYSPNNHDMGGTWVWPYNDKRVIQLCLDLKITLFESDAAADDTTTTANNNNHAVVDIAKLNKGNNNNFLESYSQLRFIGGSEQMIHGMVHEIRKDSKSIGAVVLEEGDVEDCVTILCDHQVHGIDHYDKNNTNVQTTRSDDYIKVLVTNLNTREEVYFMGKTITLAIPPRIIARDIEFHPSTLLSTQLKSIMSNTPIWMENASKAYLTYKEKLWNSSLVPCNIHGSFVFDVSNDNHHHDHIIRMTNTGSIQHHHNHNTKGKEKDNKEVNTGHHHRHHHNNMYTLCIFQVGGSTLSSSPIITKESLLKTYLEPLSQRLDDSRIISDLYDCQIQNWSLERFTSSLLIIDNNNNNSSSQTRTTYDEYQSVLPPSFLFGNSELRKPLSSMSSSINSHGNNNYNIFFSSTETEQEHGHMEGALKAGERVAVQAMKYVLG